MNVLSLFNGMSCAYMALELADIPVTNYFSSEIDKYANQASEAMFFDIIHVGDVRSIDMGKLPKIDLLCGGSPCQSFSFAGLRKGMSTKDEIEILSLEHYLELKAQDYEFEGQSYLFWEFVRVLQEVKPRYFLLENVIMEQKWERVISKALGINPIRINANLVSAQNRDRLWWTNIYAQPDGFFGDPKCMIPQPEDKGILLRDIIEQEVDEKYYLSDKMLNFLNNPHPEFIDRFQPHDINSGKVQTLRANYHKMNATDPYYKEIGGKGVDDLIKVSKTGKPKPNQNKASTFTAGGNSGGNHSDMDLLVLGCDYRKDEGLRVRSGGKSGTLAARARNDESCGQMVIIPEATKKGYTEIAPGEFFDAENLTSKTRRGRKMVDKSNCLMAKKTDFMYYEAIREAISDNHRVGGISINSRGIRPHRGDDKKTGISELGTILFADQKTDSCLTNHVPKFIQPNYRIRRLTPREAGRLQSVPEHHLDTMINSGISDTQLYKMFGNGWNVQVVTHIFKHITKD